jgi:hypothetical protein
VLYTIFLNNVILSFFAVFLAYRKRRRILVWFITTLFLGIFALIILSCLKPLKICPRCGMRLNLESRVCVQCGYVFKPYGEF